MRALLVRATAASTKDLAARRHPTRDEQRVRRRGERRYVGGGCGRAGSGGGGEPARAVRISAAGGGKLDAVRVDPQFELGEHGRGLRQTPGVADMDRARGGPPSLHVIVPHSSMIVDAGTLKAPDGTAEVRPSTLGWFGRRPGRCSGKPSWSSRPCTAAHVESLSWSPALRWRG